MSIFNELVNINKAKKILQDEVAKKKAEFEESIIQEIEALKALEEEDKRLREEVLLTLDKNNETNVIIDDSSITKQVRKTIQIKDPAVLLASISSNKDSLESLGINVEETQDAFKHDIIIKDKKVVMDVIEKYENVEGKLLDGVEEQKTSFLTIKNL